MNRTELHLLYKSETSNSQEPVTAVAFISKKSFDIILDSSDYIDPRIIEQLPHNNSGQEATLVFPDPEYHKWMEEKLMELLNT